MENDQQWRRSWSSMASMVTCNFFPLTPTKLQNPLLNSICWHWFWEHHAIFLFWKSTASRCWWQSAENFEQQWDLERSGDKGTISSAIQAKIASHVPSSRHGTAVHPKEQDARCDAEHSKGTKQWVHMPCSITMLCDPADLWRQEHVAMTKQAHRVINLVNLANEDVDLVGMFDKHRMCFLECCSTHDFQICAKSHLLRWWNIRAGKFLFEVFDRLSSPVCGRVCGEELSFVSEAVRPASWTRSPPKKLWVKHGWQGTILSDALLATQCCLECLKEWLAVNLTTSLFSSVSVIHLTTANIRTKAHIRSAGERTKCHVSVAETFGETRSSARVDTCSGGNPNQRLVLRFELKINNSEVRIENQQNKVIVVATNQGRMSGLICVNQQVVDATMDNKKSLVF